MKNKALLETATNFLSDSKVNIKTKGKRHLGAAIGSNEFRIKYVIEKVNTLCERTKNFI